MALFVAPFAGFAVGGGGHSTDTLSVSPPPSGTGDNTGPRRSPLRILGQDGRPLPKKVTKVIPPGQVPSLAPPYSWEPHERKDWKYKLPTTEARFTIKTGLVEFELKRTRGLPIPDAAKQRIDQLLQKVKLLRSQIQQLTMKAHQLVQAHKQRMQQAQQFKANDQAQAAQRRTEIAAQARAQARGPRIPRDRPTVIHDRSTNLSKQVGSAIQRYKLLKQPGVAEADEHVPFGIPGVEPTRNFSTMSVLIPTRPPAANSRNPLKAQRQAHAWIMSRGKPTSPKAEPIGLTHGPAQRQASPETQELLGVHQRIAQLRQQVTAIMNQIRQLRGQPAKAVRPVPVGESSLTGDKRYLLLN